MTAASAETGRDGVVAEYGDCPTPEWCGGVITSYFRDRRAGKDAIMGGFYLDDMTPSLVTHLASVHGLAVICDEERNRTTAVFVEPIVVQTSVDAAHMGPPHEIAAEA